MSWIKMPDTNHRTCPGIDDFIRPTIKYIKCHICGGDVEVWSDEDDGICIDCGNKWTRPEEKASCLDYCQYADQCKDIIKKRR